MEPITFPQVPEPESHVTNKWVLYSTPDEEAPEWETIGFIESIVDLIKPERVLEVGSANGTTSFFISQMMREIQTENPDSPYDPKLIAIEVDLEKANKTRYLCKDYPIAVYRQSAKSFSPQALLDKYGEMDLLFIDGCLEDRVSDYYHFRPALKDGGIAILHDVLKFDPPFSEVAAISDPKLWFATPRGVTIVQKWENS